MQATSSAVIGVRHSTAGAAGAIQGVYGSRGNLELVTCDASDGLWVFWFNCDTDTDPVAAPDVPPGTWSAGLRFATGIRYSAAQILQSPLGPDHLEVLALDDGGVLQSWYWSPERAFERRATDAALDVVQFAATLKPDGTLAVEYEELGGCRRTATSTPAGYPDRSWTSAASTAPLAVDADAEVAAAGIRSCEPGTGRASTSSRGRELTWRDAAGALRHLTVA